MTKNNALAGFVDKLVKKKLGSNKSQSILDHNDYEDTFLQIKAVGIKWKTMKGLKFRVLRGYNKAKRSCPPPPGSSKKDKTSSTQLALLPYWQSSSVNKLLTKKEIQINQEAAKNEIAISYSNWIKLYHTLKKTIPNGTYDKIFVATKQKFKLH